MNQLLLLLEPGEIRDVLAQLKAKIEGAHVPVGMPDMQMDESGLRTVKLELLQRAYKIIEDLSEQSYAR